MSGHGGLPQVEDPQQNHPGEQAILTAPGPQAPTFRAQTEAPSHRPDHCIRCGAWGFPEEHRDRVLSERKSNASPTPDLDRRLDAARHGAIQRSCWGVLSLTQKISTLVPLTRSTMARVSPSDRSRSGGVRVLVRRGPGSRTRGQCLEPICAHHAGSIE